MIILCNVQDFKSHPENFDVMWAIVRSYKYPAPSVTQVPELSPTPELYHNYLNWRKNSEWNDQKFQQEYVPKFIDDFISNRNITFPKANQLVKMSNDKNADGSEKRIGVGCFCQDEAICHRSIIAGLMAPYTNVIVNNPNGIEAYTKYADIYQQALQTAKQMEDIMSEKESANNVQKVHSIMATGHRPDKKNALYPKLGNEYGYDYSSKKWEDFKEESKKLLNDSGAEEAITGMALGTDTAFALAVLEMKQESEHPSSIKLVCAVPFNGQEQAWPKEEQEKYYDILDQADEVVTVSTGGYAEEKMLARDQYMADRCDGAIALWDGKPGSETANAVKMVLDEGKPVYHIDPQTSKETIMTTWPFKNEKIKTNLDTKEISNDTSQATAVETDDTIRFSGWSDPKYGCLSNFSRAKFHYDGQTFYSAEAAFQASKTTDQELKKEFTHLKPSEAKKMGKQLALRKDWDNVKYNCMVDILQAKFEQNPDIAKVLCSTGTKILIEDTTPYHDNTWGQCTCDKCKNEGRTERSQNLLGKALMQVRNGLQQQYGTDVQTTKSIETTDIIEENQNPKKDETELG